MGTYARVATSGCASRLSVVEEAREQAGEEEGAEREVENENVVNETIVLEAEELGRCGDCDGKAHSIADPDHDGAHVE